MKSLHIVLLVMTAVITCSCQTSGQDMEKTPPKPRTGTLTLNSTVAFLYNRKINGKEKLPIADQTLIKNCSFKGFLSTYLIIHDFSQKPFEKSYMDLKDKLLQKEDCNVFFISWDGGNNRRNVTTYLAAVKNVPLIAGQLATFLHSLHTLKSLHYDALHIIGDGLGAHIAGQVMTHDDNNNIIRRITGLDPAGLNYTSGDESNRLNKKSASYVSVIHTNGCKQKHPAHYFACYGAYYSLGHTDFFAFDGMYQPRCSKLKKGNGRHKFCDHDSAILYFLSSMDIDLSDTYFLARKAKDVNHYRNSPANCGEVPQYLGYYCNPSGLDSYFLNVTSEAPYGIQDPVCPDADHKARVIRITIGSVAGGLVFIALIGGMVLAYLRLVRGRSAETEPLLRNTPGATAYLTGDVNHSPVDV